MKYQLIISLVLVSIISSSNAWDLDQMLESSVPEQALGQVQMLQEIQNVPVAASGSSSPTATNSAPKKDNNNSTANDGEGKNCTLCLVMPIPSVVPDLNNTSTNSSTKPNLKPKKQALHASNDRVFLAIAANQIKSDDKSGTQKKLDNNGKINIITPNGGEIKLTFKPANGTNGDGDSQNTKNGSKDKNGKPLDNKKHSDSTKPPCNKSKTNGTETNDDPMTNNTRTTNDSNPNNKPMTSKQSNSGGGKSDSGNGNQTANKSGSNSPSNKIKPANELKQKSNDSSTTNDSKQHIGKQQRSGETQQNGKPERQQGNGGKPNTVNGKQNGGKDNSTGFIPPKPDLNLSKASLKYEKFSFKKGNAKNSTDEDTGNSTTPKSDTKKIEKPSLIKKMVSPNQNSESDPKTMKTQDLKNNSKDESPKKRNKRSVDEIEFMRIFGTFRKIGFWAFLTIAQNVNVFH